MIQGKIAKLIRLDHWFKVYKGIIEKELIRYHLVNFLSAYYMQAQWKTQRSLSVFANLLQLWLYKLLAENTNLVCRSRKPKWE